MSDAAPAVRPENAPRAAGTWVAYTVLLRWQWARIGSLLPLVVVVQALMGAGLVVGFGFLIPEIDEGTALFLSTGAPTVLLLTVGLVIVPNAVSRSRVDGTFTHMRALPLPRPVLLLADLTVWSVVALPGIAVAVLVAWLRFDLTLSFDWPLLIGAAALVTLTAAAVGYMVAVVLPPMVAQVLSQALVFLVLLFSPISFPASQLPGWFRTLHEVLPLESAADLIRAGLASGAYQMDGSDLVVLVAWCTVAIAVSVRSLVHRA